MFTGPVPTDDRSLGSRFAHALAEKNWAELESVMAPSFDFKGLTPGRSWEASEPTALAKEVLQVWFGETDVIDELVTFSEGRVGDRTHLSYRFRISNPDGSWLVEQQAYLDEEDDRITYLRVLCSGYRPL